MTPAKYTIATGLELSDCLAQLKPGIRVAVADRTPSRLTTGSGIRGLTLTQALNRLSADLDRYWVQRGRAVSLQCRYGKADQGPGVEIAELKEAAGDLEQLLRSAGPQFSAVDLIQAQHQFVEALTRDQQEAMLGAGLPLRNFPPAMREAWLRINTSHAYGESALEIRRLQACLSRWEQATLNDLGQERQALLLAFPGRSDENGVAMPVPLFNRRPLAAPGEGEERPPLAKTPADLQVPWSLDETLKLGELPQRFRDAGGGVLRIPEYAAERRLHIYSSGGTRAEVLWATADLWGWELIKERDGYRLGRAARRIPRTAAELHRLMRQAVPPAVWHAARAIVDGGATEQWGDQMDHVLAAAAKSGGRGWQQVRLRDLDLESQQRLANVAAALQVGKWYRSAGKMAEPPLWVSRPELGVLRLSGPIRPGEHPLISFEVEGADQKRWVWGWYVGTNTLGKK